MPDYQKMYNKLFNKVTDIISELQEVQRETEEMYMQDSGMKPDGKAKLDISDNSNNANQDD